MQKMKPHPDDEDVFVSTSFHSFFRPIARFAMNIPSSLARCLDHRARYFVMAGLVGLSVMSTAMSVNAQTPASVPSGQQASGALQSAPASSLPNVAARPVPVSATGTSGVSASPSTANPYGLGAIWLQGDWVAKACLILLTLMSTASWYVLVSKILELRRLRKQTADALGVFGDIRNFPARIAKLSAENPLRFVANAGSVAVQNYPAVRARVDYDTWLIRSIEQALSALQSRTQGGMAVLATIGSTAPFVGLFGTVWAIYSALVKIGASGQASIDRVAGPVGEALIMTAIGLAVAVPAVFGYNWLLRQNKLALDSVRGFGARLHVMLLASSDGIDVAKPAAPGPESN
jgi:biopolymer transport protein ExbB